MKKMMVGYTYPWGPKWLWPLQPLREHWVSSGHLLCVGSDCSADSLCDASFDASLTCGEQVIVLGDSGDNRFSGQQSVVLGLPFDAGLGMVVDPVWSLHARIQQGQFDDPQAISHALLLARAFLGPGRVDLSLKVARSLLSSDCWSTFWSQWSGVLVGEKPCQQDQYFPADFTVLDALDVKVVGLRVTGSSQRRRLGFRVLLHELVYWVLASPSLHVLRVSLDDPDIEIEALLNILRQSRSSHLRLHLCAATASSLTRACGVHLPALLRDVNYLLVSPDQADADLFNLLQFSPPSVRDVHERMVFFSVRGQSCCLLVSG